MLIKQVTELSRNWARLGLDKGRAALENSAERLRATAEILGSWSSKLSPAHSDAAASPSASEPSGAESTSAKASDSPASN